MTKKIKDKLQKRAKYQRGRGVVTDNNNYSGLKHINKIINEVKI